MVLNFRQFKVLLGPIAYYKKRDVVYVSFGPENLNWLIIFSLQSDSFFKKKILINY